MLNGLHISSADVFVYLMDPHPVVTSHTAHVDTRPKTRFRRARTSPRVQGHTPHTQGVSRACLIECDISKTLCNLKPARTYLHRIREANILEQHWRWSYK